MTKVLIIFFKMFGRFFNKQPIYKINVVRHQFFMWTYFIENIRPWVFIFFSSSFPIFLSFYFNSVRTYNPSLYYLKMLNLLPYLHLTHNKWKQWFSTLLKDGKRSLYSMVAIIHCYIYIDLHISDHYFILISSA